MKSCPRLASLHLVLLVCLLTACDTPTVPSTVQLDTLERQVRGEYRAEYASLEQARRSGQMNETEYQMERAALDKVVQNKVDTMLWNRHALAQSDRKANQLPTPDLPVDNPPPVAGQLANSLYNSPRMNNPLGSQIQGNIMGNSGGTNFNEARKAGTMFDPNFDQ